MRPTLFAITQCLLLSACASFPKLPAPDDCRIVVIRSEEGEHMAAIEAARVLGNRLSRCPDETQAALSTSYNLVNRADSLVRVALAERKKGNLSMAREKLRAALQLYPQYYWVRKLLRGVERSIGSRVRELQEEANYLASRGNLQDAVERLRQARRLSPEDAELLDSLHDIEGRIDAETAGHQAEASIRRARELLDIGQFDEADQVIREGNARNIFPAEVDSLFASLEDRRTVRTRELLDEAKEEARKGDHETAVHFVERAVDQGPMLDPLGRDMVEFTRQLGANLYAQGKLHLARDVWLLALGIDPDNAELLQYLEDVQIRLDRLRRIQEQSLPTGPSTP